MNVFRNIVKFMMELILLWCIRCAVIADLVSLLSVLVRMCMEKKNMRDGNDQVSKKYASLKSSVIVSIAVLILLMIAYDYLGKVGLP